MNRKQQVFVSEYLQCWNATEAARRAGYKHPNKQGPKLLVNIGIAEAIRARIAEKAMSADEVLIRLADHARGTMADFLDIDPNGNARINLEKARLAGKLHLVKTFADGPKTGIKIDLYDAQAALSLIGKAYGLFVDRQEITGADGAPLQIIGFETVKPEADDEP